jgi:hypothetical protein
MTGIARLAASEAARMVIAVFVIIPLFSPRFALQEKKPRDA